MEADEVTHLLNLIGNALAEDAKYPLEGTLLYIEIDWDMLGQSIFKDGGDEIVFRWNAGDLEEPVRQLWEGEPKHKRWSEMEYFISGGKFEVRFIYEEEIDKNEDFGDRRDRAVRRYMGDKPIFYPPLPDEGDTQRFEF